MPSRLPEIDQAAERGEAYPGREAKPYNALRGRGLRAFTQQIPRKQSANNAPNHHGERVGERFVTDEVDLVEDRAFDAAKRQTRRDRNILLKWICANQYSLVDPISRDRTHASEERLCEIQRETICLHT